MSPIAVIAGTFLIWLAARKRINLYGALVHRTDVDPGNSPASGSTVGPGADNSAAGANDLATIYRGLG